MQSTFSIRLEDKTKRSMEEICETLGLSMSAAFNIFAKAFVRNEGFPFDVRMNAVSNPIESFWDARHFLRERFPEEPSLEEINGEIQRVRDRRKIDD